MQQCKGGAGENKKNILGLFLVVDDRGFLDVMNQAPEQPRRGRWRQAK
jgi:hypothetical protein